MEEEIKRDIIAYRRQKAKDLLHDVDVLMVNELWNSAVNRMYYACFHAASALLIHAGIEAHTHTGVRQMLGKEFVQTGILPRELSKFYTNLFSKRQSSDYEDFFDYAAEDVEALYPQAVAFIDTVEKIIQS